MAREVLRLVSGLRSRTTDMALILNFVPRDPASRTPPACAVQAEAAIIIFPGVRYERRDEREEARSGRAPANSKSPTH